MGSIVVSAISAPYNSIVNVEVYRSLSVDLVYWEGKQEVLRQLHHLHLGVLAEHRDSDPTGVERELCHNSR